MKLHPILFKTEMVKALLAGTKTQTRRLLKPQPTLTERRYVDWADTGSLHVTQDMFPTTSERGLVFAYVESRGVVANMGVKSFVERFCKYEIGDVLWVRETFTELVGHHRTATDRWVYRADGSGDADAEEIRQDYIKAGFPYQWKPSLFMPFDAARIFLEVTDIRVERLHEISIEDAIAEGIEGEHTVRGFRDYLAPKSQPWPFTMNAYNSYASLWESINGKDSWQDNPFVWVYTFKQVDKPTISPHPHEPQGS